MPITIQPATLKYKSNGVYQSADSIKGDKGDRGISGIHYGAEAPTDPDVSVWIDPNGSGESSIGIDDTAGLGQTQKAWSADKVTKELTNKASAIIDAATDYRHENVDEFIINGNTYAFGNARYADKKNIIPSQNRTITLGGVSIAIQGSVAVMNGENSGGSNDGNFITQEVDMPVGEYIFSIEPYIGSTELSGAKNMHLDIWYDDNTTTTQSLRKTLSIKDTVQSVTFTTTDHVYKIRVWIGVRGSTTYDNYKLFYSLFPSSVTITDTGETISPTGYLTVEPASEMAVVDTMMHTSSVQTIIDTKTYVDNHTQEIDFVYFRPEDYGAVGDGVADDSVALQACINAAQTYDSDKGKAIRGFGTYKIATGIVFNCRELDVFLNKIVYTGADAAVQISGSFSRFVFQSIRAYSGGNYAVCIRCYQSQNSGYTTTFHSNVVTCSYMRSSGNCVEFCDAPDLTIHTIMYNDFYCQYQRSDNAHIFAVMGQTANEINCYGKYVNAENGYLVYYNRDNIRSEGIIRMFYYCLETNLKNGTNGEARFYYCRFTEMTDRQSLGDRTTGRIYVWDSIYAQGEIVSPTTGIDIMSIDVSNANSWEDCLAMAKDAFESDPNHIASEVYSRYLPISRLPYAKIEPVRRVANANMTTNNSMATVPLGTVYAYYNNLAYKPNEDIYALVDDDMTIELTAENNWKYITPTVFDINAASVTITLDASYCCIAINKFDVIQHAGKTAIVIDKLGNTIFDGTNLGAGVYHFKCSFVPYQYHEVYVTLEDGTVKYVPTSLLPIIYSGYNEKWTVTREDLIPPPAQNSQS